METIKAGAWVEGLDAGGVVIVERATGRVIATLGEFSETTKARAQLMGRAPDLAEALEAFAGAPCGCTPLQRDSGHLTDCPFPALRDAAEAALTKAGRR